MKLPLVCALALLPMPIICAAAPVHVALKAAASATPNADGFLTLGALAGITGGDKAARARFAAVPVARAPLPGETRRLTRGDLALKLRQAGINPDTQAVLEGADRAEVTTEEVPPAPNHGGVGADKNRREGAETKGAASSAPTGTSFQTPPLLGAGGTPLVIHSGDAVTILIQSGAMTVTAPATARENGRAGDTIRVQRPGLSADLSVQVLDAQTVQMEI